MYLQVQVARDEITGTTRVTINRAASGGEHSPHTFAALPLPTLPHPMIAQPVGSLQGVHCATVA